MEVERNENGVLKSALEKYTNEVLSVLINRYEKLLILSREILIKTELPENLKKFDDVRNGDIDFKDKIILSDENIAELINLLKEMVKSHKLSSGGSLAHWVEQQLCYNRLNKPNSEYLKLRKNINAMGIDNILSDFNEHVHVDGTSIIGENFGWNRGFWYTRIHNGHDPFSINVPDVFRIHITKDSVEIKYPYKDEDIEKGIKFLDDEEFKMLKKSPFSSLFNKKVMSKSEYNSLIDAIYTYNQLDESTLEYYIKASKIVADYWTNSLNSLSNKNDTSEFYFDILSRMANNNDTYISKENLEKFNLILQQQILKELIEEGYADLSVDYHPCAQLGDSARLAEINPSFPIKTWSTIDMDKVLINGKEVLTFKSKLKK